LGTGVVHATNDKVYIMVHSKAGVTGSDAGVIARGPDELYTFSMMFYNYYTVAKTYSLTIETSIDAGGTWVIAATLASLAVPANSKVIVSWPTTGLSAVSVGGVSSEYRVRITATLAGSPSIQGNFLWMVFAGVPGSGQ
jgi:hypothetical protein